mmetsp:Transcript_15781/g.22865  ORF Transcript_15781/g.22865 Transcript_15781/m.22865 type:complete len:448 (-) Transcript_15781:40-1383(-)
MANKENGANGLVLFDASKNELGSPEQGFTKLVTALQKKHSIKTNHEPLTLETLAESQLFVLGGPREMFTQEEFDALKSFLEGGGSILITLAEGGETKLKTNINYFLEEFGISANSDTVIRTVYYSKYFNPKHCFVSNGIINRELSNLAKGRNPNSNANKKAQNLVKNLLKDEIDLRDDHSGLNFVYPNGVSLNAQKPAIPLLSSGPYSLPLNRPLAALYTPKARRGRLIVVGSTSLFSDNFLEKEENQKLQDIMFRWLLGEEGVNLDQGLEEDNDLQEYSIVPEISQLSQNLKSCLQTSEGIPMNFRTMFDNSLFKFDVEMVPEAVELYQTMGVKHEALNLIPPQFEAPLPNLLPAVFPPNLKEPMPPALDLFDLDEEFASEKVRLAQLMNKYSDDDISYYVRESGEILGVTQQIGRLNFGYDSDADAKAILHRILCEIVEYKKHSQ